MKLVAISVRGPEQTPYHLRFGKTVRGLPLKFLGICASPPPAVIGQRNAWTDRLAKARSAAVETLVCVKRDVRVLSANRFTTGTLATHFSHQWSHSQKWRRRGCLSRRQRFAAASSFGVSECAASRVAKRSRHAIIHGDNGELTISSGWA